MCNWDILEDAHHRAFIWVKRTYGLKRGKGVLIEGAYCWETRVVAKKILIAVGLLLLHLKFLFCSLLSALFDLLLVTELQNKRFKHKTRTLSNIGTTQRSFDRYIVPITSLLNAKCMSDIEILHALLPASQPHISFGSIYSVFQNLCIRQKWKALSIARVCLS